jgi:hypothetical protein
MYVTVGLRNVVYFFANLKFATRLQRGSSNLRRTAHDRTNQQLNQFLLIRHPQQQSIRAHENGACTYVYVGTLIASKSLPVFLSFEHNLKNILH